MAPSSPSCENGVGWHADLTNGDGCSDDNNYPDEWLEDGLKKFMFFRTAAECCAQIGGSRECQIRDHGCSPDALSLEGDDDEPCLSIGWHADLKTRGGCTDDDDYDEKWKSPRMRGVMVFDTPEECCANFSLGPQGDCPVRVSGCRYEDPNAVMIGASECDFTTWHPDLETKVGCSNHGDFPREWLEKEGYVFDSPEACCEEFSDKDGVCLVRDMCNPNHGVAYLSGPTRSPTLHPTQQPTTVGKWLETYYTPPADHRSNGDIDFFLMSGQSNMHGQVTSPQSIGGDETYWLRIKSVIDAKGDPADMEVLLYNEIYAMNSGQPGPGVVAATLMNETMELYNIGLLHDLDVPLRLGSCSFVVPRDDIGVDKTSGGTTPTVWNASCGGIFGPELMFSRTLELNMGQQNRFEAVKIAKDGTKLYKHWSPGRGKYWFKLRSSIRSRKGYGNWRAFIWHQGTNDSTSGKGEDTSYSYLGNLTVLVDEVRTEMFDASTPGFWNCKEEIPVVIVQTGYFPPTDRGQRVREAQAKYCDGDPRAQLVRMNDLSRFYHFDAPSMLVEGHRIAQAYQLAARGEITCPLGSFQVAQSTTSLQSAQSNSPSSSSAPSTSSTSGWEEDS